MIHLNTSVHYTSIIMNDYAIHINNELKYIKLLVECREGERKFCMGEGTEDRVQACKKCVMLEPGLEMEYAQPLLTLFDELLAWDPASGDCRVIFYTEGRGRLWENRTEKEFQAFAWNHVHPRECSRFRAFFSTAHMKERSGIRGPEKLVYRQKTAGGGYAWVEVVAIAAGSGGTILCYVRDMGKEEKKQYMQEQIIDQYVYRKCDFFLCLDGDTGYYETLQKNDSRIQGQMPYAGNYKQELEACIRRYVVTEDRNLLLEKTSIGYVLDALEREGELLVSYGEKGADGRYARKLLRYVYYDRQERKILLMRQDITAEYLEQRRQKKRLNDALLHARIDFLTGLYNRQAVNAKINAVLGAAAVMPPSVLLFIDLDNFKTVNDTLGHRYGDRVLCSVAECFRQVLRTSDIIGRVGGDEFVAFLSGVTSIDEAGECAGRLCQAVSCIPDLELKGCGLSCSIGGAVCPRDGKDYDSLLMKADIAVYEAKRRGKNQFAFYEPGMKPHSEL